MARRRNGFVRRLALGLVLLLVVMGVGGAAWNYLAVRQAREAHPPPGRTYDVDGYAMHLFCTGTGSPTLVLESGHGEDFTVWGKVQPALSRITRTCSYDRAGFGWSDAQPGERDAVHIARQLHALLLKADITTPVVLMGHSAGGLYARVYASTFPKGVAGLVLVDATAPDPSPQPAFSVALDHHGAAEFTFVKAMVALGIARATGQCDTVPDGLEAYAPWIKADACHYSQLDTYVAEDRALGGSRMQAARRGPFGDLPLLVLSRDPNRPIPAFLAGRVTDRDWQDSASAHDRDQAAFLRLSTNGRRVVVTGSGHYIQYDRPDVVIAEVTAFIGRLRDSSETAPH